LYPIEAAVVPSTPVEPQSVVIYALSLVPIFCPQKSGLLSAWRRFQDPEHAVNNSLFDEHMDGIIVLSSVASAWCRLQCVLAAEIR
jgi:hypothetical protein